MKVNSITVERFVGPLVRVFKALSKRGKVVLISGVISAVVTVAVAIGGFLPLHPFSGGPLSFDVRKGASCRAVAKRLKEERIIRNAFLFRVLGRLRGADRRIKAGEYLLGTDRSSWSILSVFLNGDVILHRLVAREGFRVSWLAMELGRRGLVNKDEFLALIEDREFIAAQGIASESLEGFLFPETYLIPKGMPAKDLVAIMLDRFKKELPPDFSERAKIMGLREDELVVLASIVEKEARVAEERPIVAAVFFRRIKSKMRLESCATVQYVIGYDREVLRESDLAVKSPYNTYLHGGLPPGAICNPGAESLSAAAHPADVEFMYFVAKGDGRHEFSVTFEEHLRKKERIKRERRKLSSSRGGK